MLKKRMNLFFSFVLSILVSTLAKAQIHGGPRGRFGGFDGINLFGSDISGILAVWVPIILIFFVFLNLLLNKAPVIKNSRPGRIVISGCLAILSAYGLATTGFDSSWIVPLLGISFSDIMAYLPLLGIGALLGFFIWKGESFSRGLGMGLIVLGSILMFISIIGLVYEQLIVFIAGLVLFIIGILLYRKGGGKGGGEDPPEQGQDSSELTLNLSVSGNGNTNPKPGSYKMKKGKRAKIKAIPNKNSQFEYFLVNNKKSKRRKLSLKMKRNYDVIAYFSSKKGPKPGPNPGPSPGPNKKSKKRREAYLGVVVGGKDYSGTKNPTASLDLSKGGNSVTVTVKNEGNGGKLGWAARAQGKYLDVSPKSGSLKAGGSRKVTITPKWEAIKKAKKQYVGLSISGRGGGRQKGIPQRGRVGIWIKVA